VAMIGTKRGPTGHLKNCNLWGEYEQAGTSAEANLCNGGRFGNEVWARCPSVMDCRKATYQAQESSQAPSRIIGSTQLNRYSRTGTSISGLVQRKTETPSVGLRKRIPGVEAEVVDMGGASHSPVFLPSDGEGTFTRMAKNMGQGAIAAMFFHGLAIAQSVDFFPHNTNRENE